MSQRLKNYVLILGENIHLLNLFVFKGEEVVRDETYKYLGIVIESKLKWNENTEHDEKVNSKMYCPRKLKRRSQCGSSSDVL